MIRAEKLSLTIGSFSLHEVNLSVEQGESFFLLGPSGAGKTLLLELLLGLHKPQKGRVLIDGTDITGLPAEERRVAYVPQKLALFPHLSVRENILFGFRARGQTPFDVKERLGRMVELLDLGSFIERARIDGLSGGETQRVALARALITEPRVIFMDEPFSALDVSLRRRLQTEFRELQQRLGLTLVQVTHDPEEAFLMADKMAILMDGRVEQTGAPAQLYNRPATLKAARFLMLKNLFDARIGPRTEEGYQKIELDQSDYSFQMTPTGEFAENAKVVVGVRPEEVIILEPNHSPDTAMQRNIFLGEVESWADLGHYRLVRLRVGELKLDSWLNMRDAREHPMAVGMEVWIHIRPWSLCLLRPED